MSHIWFGPRESGWTLTRRLWKMQAHSMSRESGNCPFLEFFFSIGWVQSCHWTAIFLEMEKSLFQHWKSSSWLAWGIWRNRKQQQQLEEEKVFLVYGSYVSGNAPSWLNSFFMYPVVQRWSLFTLKYLIIFYCPHLKRQCKKDTGKDWPKISHITEIVIDVSTYRTCAIKMVDKLQQCLVVETGDCQILEASQMFPSYRGFDFAGVYEITSPVLSCFL